MPDTFTKLFGSIVRSTIWCESNETRIVWMTLLALADSGGNIFSSTPGLAHTARVSLDLTEAAIEKLKSPDKYSRTKDHEGRRIEDIDGGWHLLNHAKYRSLMSYEERKEYNRVKQQEHRERMSKNVKEVIDKSTSVMDSQQKSAMSAHSDSDSDSDSDKQLSDLSTNPHSSQKTVKRETLFPIDQEAKKKDESPEFVKAWNALGRPFKEIEVWSKKRNAAFQSRMRDSKFDWRKLLGIISKSPFCQGQNDRGWIADVEFFLRPGTYIKAMEGKYDERVSSFGAKHSGGGAATTAGKRKQLEDLFGKAKKSLPIEPRPLGSDDENAGRSGGNDSGGESENPESPVSGNQVRY